MHLSDGEKLIFSWVPLSSALVWGSCIIVGIWVPDWHTDFPWTSIFALTLFTYLLYLPSSYFLKRFYVRGKNQNISVPLRLFVASLGFGAVWGLLTSPIGPAFKFIGPVCGAVVGLTLAVALRKS